MDCFCGKENASARQIDAIMRCVLRFSLFIVDGKLAIAAARGGADRGWADTWGLRNSCSLATILLSPRYLNGSPPPPLPSLSLHSLHFLSQLLCH